MNLIYKNIKLSVIFFLGTNCPITQNTTIEINRIFEKYNYTKNIENTSNKKRNNFDFKAVFPNLDDNNSQINNFKKKYKIKFDCMIDSNQYLTNKFDMTTLPEVVIFDKDSVILYKGKIDDLYFDIGKRRQTDFKRILDLKLDSLQKNCKLLENYVKPLGCVIEKRK